VSIEQQIADLEKLVETDAEIKELTDHIQQEKSDIDGVRSEVEELEGRLSGDRDSISEMDKTRNDLVQELRQISSQIERSRERLQRARNEREVNAAERELDELRKIQRDRDDEVKKLVGLADMARESIHAGESRIGELNTRLEGSLEGKTKSIAELETQLVEAQERRNVVGAKLPSRVFRRYESINRRGRVPVAKSHDGTCLGCFVKLPPMLFHQMLSRTEFGECPNCHRLIYYAPKPEPGSEKAGLEESPADEDGSDGESASGQASSEASS
jgi:predicted  nucleic acid-binding Zn-ribbon protein